MREARALTLLLMVCATACATKPQVIILNVAPPRVTLTAGKTAAAARPAQPPPASPDIGIPDHRSVFAALAYFTNELRPDIQESLLRSARYKKMIDAALDAHQLPKALAYLPVIESAYVPTLTSRAGAHGMWQFMPQTAREYGLRVNRKVDERTDPELSTRAAAAYLKDLYREFGDWPLALAAYNAGPARIHRAMEETCATTFWELLERRAVPRETRGYVPTFFATIIIAADPAAYGFRIEAPVDEGPRAAGGM